MEEHRSHCCWLERNRRRRSSELQGHHLGTEEDSSAVTKNNSGSVLLFGLLSLGMVLLDLSILRDALRKKSQSPLDLARRIIKHADEVSRDRSRPASIREAHSLKRLAYVLAERLPYGENIKTGLISVVAEILAEVLEGNIPSNELGLPPSCTQIAYEGVEIRVDKEAGGTIFCTERDKKTKCWKDKKPGCNKEMGPRQNNHSHGRVKKSRRQAKTKKSTGKTGRNC